MASRRPTPITAPTGTFHRFLGEDFLKRGRPNLYPYVLNNPLRFYDPFGLQYEGCTRSAGCGPPSINIPPDRDPELVRNAIRENLNKTLSEKIEEFIDKGLRNVGEATLEGIKNEGEKIGQKILEKTPQILFQFCARFPAACIIIQDDEANAALLLNDPSRPTQPEPPSIGNRK